MAVLSNYPIGIKKQNTNDNLLYQNIDPSLLKTMEISREQVALRNFIGSGAFGQVYEGTFTHDNSMERVAIKVFLFFLKL